MTTLDITIGKLHIKVRSLANGKDEKAAHQTNRCTVCRLGAAAKNAALEGLRNLQAKVEAYLAKRDEEYMGQFPPHSLFCEGRCCQKSFRAYHQFLKREMQWDKNGHLR